MAINAKFTVPGPARVPHRFGLFSAVPVVEVTDPHALMGVQWEGLTCERPTIVPDQCPCPTTKEFLPPAPVLDADPFTVLGSWECALGGNTVAEAQTKARQHLTVGEQHAVEWAVWTGQADLFEGITEEEAFHGPRFAHPSTPQIGTASCPKDLLALIEDYTAGIYTGQPLVHLPRAVLPHLASDGLITTVGTRLETPYGTPLVAGAGYGEANTGPDGTRAPDGSWWVYVTGAMQVWRGDVFTPPNPQAGFSRCNNEFTAIAERTYLAGWDCFTAAVLFTPCCTCGDPTYTFPPAPEPAP